MAKSEKLNFIVNLVLFQAIWFAAILGAANANLFWCYGLFAALVVWQFLPQNRKAGDCLNVLNFLLIGFILDSAWYYLELIEYKQHISWFNTAPIWILMLWVAFALSLNHSMSWVHSKPKLAYLMGFVGGPLSYFGGERLGAITISSPWVTATCLSLAWGSVIWFALNIKKQNFTNIFQLMSGNKTHA
ncbi:DUF2878 domain-containing protein [Kangiella sp. HZ709]|uniref:DUF2878 domain-containing protein n=1 Tax=Kangiella sp. HZ709 TaxID=2666328 RepID=UPI0012B0908C|nr:DUF2878 domain-containing protein [Kangiella sp. HZ709]MRX27786.1 DUF2878 family protein [Kangiella sp. HZ709]